MIPRKLVCAFAVLTCLWSPAFSEEAPAPSSAEVKSPKPKKKSKPNVAVADFEATEGLSKSVAIIVSNVISDTLLNTGRFTVIERTAMDAILKEQAFQKSGCTSQECAVEIGKLLNVRFMVIGTVSFLGESGRGDYTVSAKVIDVELGHGVASKEVTVQSQTALRGAAREAALAVAPIVLGDKEIAIQSGDSGGFLQDLLTVLGVVGAFVGAALSGQ